MEEKIKKIIILIDTKIENFIKELQEKKKILKNVLNLILLDIDKFNINMNYKNRIENEKKQIFKISNLINQIHNILITEYKNDFMMNAKQIINLFDYIEDNEPIYINKHYNYILTTNENNHLNLRMIQKNLISNFGSRVTSVCSLYEKNSIYNKLYIGLAIGNIMVYDVNSGNKLLKIPEALRRNEAIIDICSLSNGIIACSDGYYNISVIRIIEEDFIDEDNISYKCSFEIIQKILSKEKERYAANKIINIKLTKLFFQNNLGNYINDYIVQSGWSHLKIYIKKNNDRYYFYKNILIPSRIISLFNYEKHNIFFGNDYFSGSIYLFSSITMELKTIIKGINENGINWNNPFNYLNKKIFVFLGLHSLYLYNINNMKLIQEIKFEKKTIAKNIILSKNNSLLISVFNLKNNNHKIMEFEYIQEEKKLRKKSIINCEESLINKCEKEDIFFLSNNKYGKKYLIILNHEEKIIILK